MQKYSYERRGCETVAWKQQLETVPEKFGTNGIMDECYYIFSVKASAQ